MLVMFCGLPPVLPRPVCRYRLARVFPDRTTALPLPGHASLSCIYIQTLMRHYYTFITTIHMAGRGTAIATCTNTTASAEVDS